MVWRFIRQRFGKRKTMSCHESVDSPELMKATNGALAPEEHEARWQLAPQTHGIFIITTNIYLVNIGVQRVIHRWGLVLFLYIEYNVYQVGKSGKSVDNNLFRKLMNKVNIIFFTPVK